MLLFTLIIDSNLMYFNEFSLFSLCKFVNKPKIIKPNCNMGFMEVLTIKNSYFRNYVPKLADFMLFLLLKIAQFPKIDS